MHRRPQPPRPPSLSLPRCALYLPALLRLVQPSCAPPPLQALHAPLPHSLQGLPSAHPAHSALPQHCASARQLAQQRWRHCAHAAAAAAQPGAQAQSVAAQLAHAPAQSTQQLELQAWQRQKRAAQPPEKMRAQPLQVDSVLHAAHTLSVQAWREHEARQLLSALTQTSQK